ncbi:MAG: MGMT family protein [Steroidobacteraceae bacterium]
MAVTSSPRALDERIYGIVRRIPRGRVAAYGWIAELAGLPRGARRVGRALKALPASHRVPWYRVVTASGRIAFPPGSAAARRQQARLIAEGVEFRRGRIELGRFGWRRTLDEQLWGPA